MSTCSDHTVVSDHNLSTEISLIYVTSSEEKWSSHLFGSGSPPWPFVVITVTGCHMTSCFLCYCSVFQRTNIMTFLFMVEKSGIDHFCGDEHLKTQCRGVRVCIFGESCIGTIITSTTRRQRRTVAVGPQPKNTRKRIYSWNQYMMY